jgi:uncharacterized membrane protein
MPGIDTLVAFAATYGTEGDALADYEAIKDLYYGLDLIDTFDAAVVEKSDQGKVKILKKHEQPTRHGAWLGGGVGLATGLVAALFPAVAIGAGVLYGTGIGAGLGALAGHAAGGMKRSDLKALGELLDNGQYGLVAVAAADMTSRVEKAIARAGEITTKELTSDADKLARDLTDAQGQSASTVDLTASSESSGSPESEAPSTVTS